MREKLRVFLGQSRISVLPSKRSGACRRESPAGGARSGAILTIAATALALSACAQAVEPENPLQTAMNTKPTNSVFEKHLYADYLVQAVAESGKGNTENSQYYATKALAVAESKQVGPAPVDDTRVPPTSLAELRQNRERLVSVLDGGAGIKAPADAARAQTKFDCWNRNLEHREPAASALPFLAQPMEAVEARRAARKAAAACRESFDTAMAKVERAFGEHYTIYFDFDSAEPSDDAMKMAMEAAAAAQAIKGATLLIAGHADSAGDAAYNLALSQHRADAIRQLLLSAGVKAEQIGTANYGETQPSVHTPDETAEGKNRRVEINVVK
ncbi:MAG: OmpA family protein [Rhodospirillales bacterium]|nr:OmpA family protein [Rhodospirillales bacterium]